MSDIKYDTYYKSGGDEFTVVKTETQLTALIHLKRKGSNGYGIALKQHEGLYGPYTAKELRLIAETLREAATYVEAEDPTTFSPSEV